MEGALLVQQVVGLGVGEEDELLVQQAGEEKEGLLLLVLDSLRVHELKQLQQCYSVYLVEVHLREAGEESSQLLGEGGGKVMNLLEQLVEGEEKLGREVPSADH